ncbi:hypothetical protein CWI38_0851p0010 [Hamiltosporidium tvaerminnensis]|uniref:Uncharacterized protein n=1 Tax=Hamiltosporidium tvaerminnensis TaxID=1176355 RepID=A0A4Q9LV12_9MICR|nr:hypothetical protein CWI38_0851p0010 [Hamiltosporidium tvaerminnensis]
MNLNSDTNVVFYIVTNQEPNKCSNAKKKKLNVHAKKQEIYAENMNIEATLQFYTENISREYNEYRIKGIEKFGIKFDIFEIDGKLSNGNSNIEIFL